MKKILLTFALGVMSLGAHAAGWPDKPVTLVVPFPPGGSTDQVARALAADMGQKLHQTFIVENRAGATGTIGAGFVARARTNGEDLAFHRLLLCRVWNDNPGWGLFLSLNASD